MTLNQKRSHFLAAYIAAKMTVNDHILINMRRIRVDDYLLFLQRQITDEIWRLEFIMIPRCNKLKLKGCKEEAEKRIDKLKKLQYREVKDFDIEDFFNDRSEYYSMRTTIINNFYKQFFTQKK